MLSCRVMCNWRYARRVVHRHCQLVGVLGGFTRLVRDQLKLLHIPLRCGVGVTNFELHDCNAPLASHGAGSFNRSHKHGVSSGHSWNAFTYLTGEVSEPMRNSIDVRHVSCGWQLND
jgi:hypothetical protein